MADVVSKVSVRDSVTDIIYKLSEGNPGAVAFLAELFHISQREPLVFAEAVRLFQALDLRGAGIYMLWNDCLDRSSGAFVQLLSMWRKGEFPELDILEAVNLEGGRGRRINVPGRWLI